jgi:FtsH-binding integral membrane protein
VKQGSGVSASVAAIVSSLATMFCCLPLAFAAAIGTAGASAFLLKFRPWFLVLSVVLLGLGFWQQRRAQQCAVKGRIFGLVLLWTAVVVVGGMILFPQLIAGFIADRMSGP